MPKLPQSELLKEFKKDVFEALIPLEHSFIKLMNQPIPADLSRDQNLDQLEPWEAFISRFARVTDIFISKYIRLKVLEIEPGFQGETRDFLDKAEKASLIKNADVWMQVRELRNKISHEYTKDDLKFIFENLLKFTPIILAELKDFKS